MELQYTVASSRYWTLPQRANEKTIYCEKKKNLPQLMLFTDGLN